MRPRVVPDAQVLASGLPPLWRQRAAQLRDWADASSAARAWELAAQELEAALKAEDDKLLTLAQAAALSGYSTDSLRRMVREGKLQRVGRGQRLYFRAGDLPRKPTAKSFGVDVPHLVEYDPDADARMVARRRQHGE
jgi:hypothetical protein